MKTITIELPRIGWTAQGGVEHNSVRVPYGEGEYLSLGVMSTQPRLANTIIPQGAERFRVFDGLVTWWDNAAIVDEFNTVVGDLPVDIRIELV